MNYEDLTNILIEILLANSKKSEDTVSFFDILKLIIPVISTLIAFALGYLHSERALIKSKKIDSKEKEIEISNKLVFEVLAAYKEISYFRERFKALIGDETDPINRVFKTRVWSPSSKEITIKHFEIGFINKFEKYVGDEIFGLSKCDEVCTLLDNINILFKSLEQRNEIAKSAHEKFIEHSDKLGIQSVVIKVDIKSLWLWAYTNEQFLNAIDRVHYACLDFITSYPKVARQYFKHDNLETGIAPLESTSFEVLDFKSLLPITEPNWEKTLEKLEISEEEIEAQFTKSSYDKYIIECEKYLKEFTHR
tara:strand:- start:221 stop:1144 length:924 start_codon:yes stop_codon:yes gene_type:complete